MLTVPGVNTKKRDLGMAYSRPLNLSPYYLFLPDKLEFEIHEIIGVCR